MRKLSVILISLFLGLAVFAGCTVPSVTYEYSFRFGQDAAGEDGLLEYYKYTLSTDSETSGARSNVPAFEIDSGSYQTWIYKTGASKYRIETKLNIDGSYVLKNDDGQIVYQSGEFSDEITGMAEFSVTAAAFVTEKFEKTFLKTFYSLDTTTSKYKTVKYSYNITGTYSGGKMQSVLKDIPLEDAQGYIYQPVQNDKNKNFSVELDRYADNETFFLMLRLQDISETFSDNFQIADPFNAILPARTWDVAVVANAEQPETRTLEGRDIDGFTEEEHEVVDCVRLTGSIRGTSQKGQPLKMLFTKGLKYTYSSLNAGGAPIANTYPTDLQLLIEFAQEGILYSLSEYKNHAIK